MFEEDIEREKQLYAELASQPIVTITGVVDALGAGSSQYPKQPFWTLLFTFDAWQVDGQAINKQKLTIRRQIQEAQLDESEDALGAETIVRISARLSLDSSFGSPQGLLEEIVETDVDDKGLAAMLEQIQSPVTYEDDFFGTLTYSREYAWYTSPVQWLGSPIQLTLSVESDEELVDTLSTAKALWKDAADWNARVADFATSKLLPLKNASWLGEDETEISEKQFLDRMKLESINVFAEGDFDFFHTDGDLFWGHAIQIGGHINEGPKFADIPG